jgi:hypothetical protein
MESLSVCISADASGFGRQTTSLEPQWSGLHSANLSDHVPEISLEVSRYPPDRVCPYPRRVLRGSIPHKPNRLLDGRSPLERLGLQCAMLKPPVPHPTCQGSCLARTVCQHQETTWKPQATQHGCRAEGCCRPKAVRAAPSYLIPCFHLLTLKRLHHLEKGRAERGFDLSPFRTRRVRADWLCVCVLLCELSAAFPRTCFSDRPWH